MNDSGTDGNSDASGTFTGQWSYRDDVSPYATVCFCDDPTDSESVTYSPCPADVHETVVQASFCGVRHISMIINANS